MEHFELVKGGARCDLCLMLQYIMSRVPTR